MTTARPASTAHISQMRVTEAQLKAQMLAGLEGDAGAHASLLRACAPLVRRFFARRLQRGAGDLEDLVQEALIAIHMRRESFDRERPFTAWLFSIARHKLVDHFRRSARRQAVDGLDDILAQEGFEQSSNAAMDIDRLLHTLPAKQARAIRQTKIEGLSVAEAASLAGLSVSDVKVSVHRGLKALRASIAFAGAGV